MVQEMLNFLNFFYEKIHTKQIYVSIFKCHALLKRQKLGKEWAIWYIKHRTSVFDHKI